MKCVKAKDTKVIDRVTDERASALVASGTHTYASKQDWKKSKKQEGGSK